MRLHYIALLLLIPAFLLICGCKSKLSTPKPVTSTNTASIKVGMPYSEVVKIIGREGVPETINGKLYTWELGSGTAMFQFVENRYIRFSTSGTMPADFEQKTAGLKPGQDDYQKIAQLLGKEGKEMVGAKAYVWMNGAPGTATSGIAFRVICQDGKVLEKDESHTPK